MAFRNFLKSNIPKSFTPAQRKHVFNFFGFNHKDFTKIHALWPFKEMSSIDIFHLFCPNITEKAKNKIKPILKYMFKNTMSLLSEVFQNKTQWLNYNWKIAWEHDIIPSDWSPEYINVYDFKALAKISIIAHRTMSALCTGWDLLFKIEDLDATNKYNAQALKAFLTYHIYGTRLFAMETQQELLDFTSKHSFNISDLCFVFFYCDFLRVFWGLYLNLN